MVLPQRLADDLSRMLTGTVHLSVPLRDDVVQVGCCGTLTTGTITVRKTPSTLEVRRAGGDPLQAQIIHRGNDGTLVRRTVFTEPVDSLRLRCLPRPDGPQLWMVTRSTPVRRPSELVQFVQTVVAFGATKQIMALTPPTPATGGPAPARRPPG